MLWYVLTGFSHIVGVVKALKHGMVFDRLVSSANRNKHMLLALLLSLGTPTSPIMVPEYTAELIASQLIFPGCIV